MKKNFQKTGKRFELIKSFEFQLPQDMSLFDPLSLNKVTGASINLPVSETCQPSKVCAKLKLFVSRILRTLNIQATRIAANQFDLPEKTSFPLVSLK